MGRPLNKPQILNLLYIYPYGNEGHSLINRQKGSRRYTVNGYGETVFRLVPTTDLDPGQAYMLAYDSYGNNYFVTKLTRHHATVFRNVNNESSWQFENGQAVKWVPFLSPVENQTVLPEWND